MNNRDQPIKIEASVDTAKNMVSVHIVGTDEDGSYVQMTYATWLVYGNKEYPETATGYKAATYRSVFDKNGNLLEGAGGPQRVPLLTANTSTRRRRRVPRPEPTPTEPPSSRWTRCSCRRTCPTPLDPVVPSDDPGYY